MKTMALVIDDGIERGYLSDLGRGNKEYVNVRGSLTNAMEPVEEGEIINRCQ